MIVMSRSVNESVQIGDDIRVHIVSIREDRVRIGIEMNGKSTRILDVKRSELADPNKNQTND